MADNVESVTKYGTRKLGAEEFAKQKSAKVLESRGGTKYGSRKGGGEPAFKAGAPASAPITGDTSGAATTSEPKGVALPSIAKLEKALAKKPLLLDAALAAELASPKPRKGALELFRLTESERKKGPRAEVMQQINGAIAALPKAE